MGFGRFAGYVALTLLAIAAGAQENRRPHEVLRKVFESQVTQRYSGARIVEIRREGERRRHTEYVLRDGRRTRIEFARDSQMSGQVIVEADGQRRHFFPDRNVIRVGPPRRDITLGRLRELAEGAKNRRVQMLLSAGPTVAGLPTQRITWRDRQGNVLTTLDVHEDTGIVLRRELFDGTGARSGLFEFQRIDLRPTVDAKDFKLERRGAKIVNPDDELLRLSREQKLPIVRIPASAAMDLESVRAIKVGDQDVVEQIYGGERGRVALYLMARPLDAQRLRRLAGGDVTVVPGQVRGAAFVLIGDQPEPMLRRLADLLQRPPRRRSLE